MITLFTQTVPFEKIELVSLHIPKTAGISFLTLLEGHYGKYLQKAYNKDLITRINHGTLKQLPAHKKAIHGHFEINDRNKHLFAHARIICWLREPVSRIVSHYNFWNAYPAHDNPVHNRFLSEKPDILAFGKDPFYYRSVNAYQAFTGGLQKDDFFFIGRTEHFEEDYNRLAASLHLKNHTGKMPRENTGKGAENIHPEIKLQIEALIPEELRLYRSLVNQPG